MDEFALLLLKIYGSIDPSVLEYHRKDVKEAFDRGYDWGKAEAEEKVANAIGLTKAVQ